MIGNSGHLAIPVLQSLIVASGALLQWTLSSLATRGTAMKKQNNQQNPKSTKELQLFLKIRNGIIRSTRKQSTAKSEEGYCNIEATQSGSLTRSQSHQAQNTGKHTGVKQRRAWTKEEIREVIGAICISGSILQKITRKCMKYRDNVNQKAECTWMLRNYKIRKTTLLNKR
jgi:hypothetical protein